LTINDLGGPARASRWYAGTYEIIKIINKKFDFRHFFPYVVCMITIIKNPNFNKFFQVFAFGQCIDEVERQSKAIRLATKLAKENNQEFISVDGEIQKV